jgi:hypothetical protein
MVEVFKTTVSDSYYAKLLLLRIHARFPAYQANFDLSDCDRILRIKSPASIDIQLFFGIFWFLGYLASLLPDVVVAICCLNSSFHCL